MAKLKSKTNWFKGKKKGESPGASKMSPGGSKPDTTPASIPSPEQDRSMETTTNPVRKFPRKLARKGKKRGPNRQTLTLGGEKRMEKATKRKISRMVNKERGRAGIKATKKTRAQQVMMEPPVSCLWTTQRMGYWPRDYRKRKRD